MCTQIHAQVRIDRVLSQMGLEHARHTIVGTPLKKGISGGERKRLSVGMELLVEPKLIFLGEQFKSSVATSQIARVNVRETVHNTESRPIMV
jgi:ABC-type multidrug transport system ATPase subunit